VANDLEDKFLMQVILRNGDMMMLQRVEDQPQFTTRGRDITFFMGVMIL
jgi:hypothetical protein